jgi:hypothetical protein
MFADPAGRRFALTAAVLLTGASALPSLALTQERPHAAVGAAMPASLSAPSVASVVTIVANDFAFDLPASIPAGLTTFRLIDRGKQQHHLAIVRLDSGKTAAEGLAALIKAGQGPRPAWLHPVGGLNAIMPGGEGVATLVLEPGNYLAFCEVPGPDPAPHFMKGMAKGFTVTPPAKSGALPKADLTLTMTDYDFVLSRPLTSGHHVIAVTNTASQPHMVVITRFPPGKGHKDFLEWAYNPQGKPAPGVAMGGVTEIAPGRAVVIEGDFQPGRYGMICFTADATDGKPHFLHGMEKEFTVR